MTTRLTSRSTPIQCSTTSRLMISYGRRTNSISEGGKASSEEAQYTMEASGQRQATKAGSINAWVAHSKYGGNHDRNAMGTRIMISPGRHCHADAPCFFFPHHSLYSSCLVFKKRCLRGVIAVAVAIFSRIYSLASSERVVHSWWHDCSCVS